MSNTPQTLKDGAIALVIALFLIALGALGAYFLLKRHFQAPIEALKPEAVKYYIHRQTNPPTDFLSYSLPFFTLFLPFAIDAILEIDIPRVRDASLTLGNVRIKFPSLSNCPMGLPVFAMILSMRVP